jgi:hypothetical protein
MEEPTMKSAQLNRLLLIAGVGLAAVSCAAYARAQAKPAAGGSYNLTKEVMEKKGAIVWKNAPANAIPQDVCAMFAVCTGSTKLIALPKATEGGSVLGRGLFLTQDAKHADVVVLERQALGQDTYFFLLNGDGSLAKTAYAQVTSTSWQLMGNALSEPTFEKDKAAWQKGLAKFGTAPAAAAGADKKDAPAQ